MIRNIPAGTPASYRQVRVRVKETETMAWVCRPDDPYPLLADAALPPAQVTVPRQLPAALYSFAGRERELRAMSLALERAAAPPGTMAITVIEGTAGVGKSTLAVTWARQMADRFPDGQLCVNLRGFDPAGAPLAPAEAMRGFLEAFQVPPESIPVSLEAQAALYRSLLGDRRILVVLDNACDAGQVRPLLPRRGAPWW